MIAKTKIVSGINTIENWFNVLCDGMNVSSHHVLEISGDKFLISVIGENMKEENPNAPRPAPNSPNPGRATEQTKDNRIQNPQPKNETRLTPDAQKKQQKHIR